MRCEEIQEHLSAYLENEVGPAERPAMEDHLEGCLRCRHELELLRRTVGTLQSLQEIEVPPRLTAAVQAGVTARRGSWWQNLASRLFFPMHIKLPLEAMALILISLGAVYLYRSAPELAQAPRPPAVTERVSRARDASQGAGVRDEVAALKQSAAKTEPRLEVQAEREAGKGAEPRALEEKDVGVRRFGLMRKEAPAESELVAPVRELTLKTENPSRAASRIAEIAETLGGRLLETRDHHRLVIMIPARAHAKFLTALRDVGAPVDTAKEAPLPAPSQGFLTFSLRLIP